MGSDTRPRLRSSLSRSGLRSHVGSDQGRACRDRIGRLHRGRSLTASVTLIGSRSTRRLTASSTRAGSSCSRAASIRTPTYMPLRRDGHDRRRRVGQTAAAFGGPPATSISASREGPVVGRRPFRLARKGRGKQMTWVTTSRSPTRSTAHSTSLRRLLDQGVTSYKPSWRTAR
jgi:hypothetical protein